MDSEVQVNNIIINTKKLKKMSMTGTTFGDIVNGDDLPKETPTVSKETPANDLIKIIDEIEKRPYKNKRSNDEIISDLEDLQKLFNNQADDVVELKKALNDANGDILIKNEFLKEKNKSIEIGRRKIVKLEGEIEFQNRMIIKLDNIIDRLIGIKI